MHERDRPDLGRVERPPQRQEDGVEQHARRWQSLHNLCFTNAKASDYRPASGSVLIDSAGKAPLTVPEAYADVFQLVPGERPVKRGVIGSGADLGAYEAG